jgi:hypothetical protein
MKRKYIIAALVAIVLFLLYSRRVSGLGSCASPSEAPNAAGVCQSIPGSIATTSTTAVTTKTTQRVKR